MLFGHVQLKASKNAVFLNMVQKGEYWFNDGTPLQYKKRLGLTLAPGVKNLNFHLRFGDNVSLQTDSGNIVNFLKLCLGNMNVFMSDFGLSFLCFFSQFPLVRSKL